MEGDVDLDEDDTWTRTHEEEGNASEAEKIL
jgi:hypothetical protein